MPGNVELLHFVRVTLIPGGRAALTLRSPSGGDRDVVISRDALTSWDATRRACRNSTLGTAAPVDFVPPPGAAASRPEDLLVPPAAQATRDTGKARYLPDGSWQAV